MNPGLIIQPLNKEDIKLTIQYAKANNIAIAIRTGGHQYSGASSTGRKNILLDLKTTFQGPDDRKVLNAGNQTFVRTSVSWDLGSFNIYLGQHHYFVPTGQCENVHIGGHAQTGGYGQLGRSFGLFGDHVVSLEIIDHNGEEQEIRRDTNPDQFYAWLGGSPGNLGVLTHFTIRVHRNEDHVGSKGLKALYLYDPTTLKRLLGYIVQMANNPDFPRNYDLCVSVLSESFPLHKIWPGLDNDMQRDDVAQFGTDHMPAWPAMIVVYAQYCPMNKTDKCDDSWFETIGKGRLLGQLETKPMSDLTSDWIFRNVREFNKPYVKRTYGTASTTLDKDGWIDWVTGRMDDLVTDKTDGRWLSAQIQCFGGKNSMFYRNRINGTAYSWRDSTVIATIDCFHDPDPDHKQDAEDWQTENDKASIGPRGKFSKQDRRFLWGSYGSFDLNSVWNTYFEDEAKYRKLQQARKAADPDGVFTPNTFCVKRAA